MDVFIRPPCLEDGAAIKSLVKNSGTLDLNSTYLYFLLAGHFAQTCAVAETNNGELVGFVTAYRLPDNPDILFVWQIAVSDKAQGQGLAFRLLQNLSHRDWFSSISQVQCTISPSNQASNGLFAKFADHLNAELVISPFLEKHHLGEEHEEEPLVALLLPS